MKSRNFCFGVRDQFDKIAEEENQISKSLLSGVRYQLTKTAEAENLIKNITYNDI